MMFIVLGEGASSGQMGGKQSGTRKARVIFFRSLLTMAFDFVIGYDVVVVNALFDYFDGRGAYFP